EGSGEMALQPTQIAECVERVVAGGGGNAAVREEFQRTEQGRADVAAGPMDLTLGVGTHDGLLRGSPTHRKERVSHRQLQVGTRRTELRGAQAAGRPLPDRDDMDFKYGCGLSLGLISPSPPHGQDTRGCHHNARMTGGRRLTATHPHRRSFGTARRIRWYTGSHV